MSITAGVVSRTLGFLTSVAIAMDSTVSAATHAADAPHRRASSVWFRKERSDPACWTAGKLRSATKIIDKQHYVYSGSLSFAVALSPSSLLRISLSLAHNLSLSL